VSSALPSLTGIPRNTTLVAKQLFCLHLLGTFEPCSDFFRAGFFDEKPLFHAKNVVFLLELLPFYELKKLLLPGLYWIE